MHIVSHRPTLNTMLVAFKPDFHSRWPLMAYHELDNCLSCLGCVTDWQQETRGLFSFAGAGGTCH
jgi:hypothetical protein